MYDFGSLLSQFWAALLNNPSEIQHIKVTAACSQNVNKSSELTDYFKNFQNYFSAGLSLKFVALFVQKYFNFEVTPKDETRQIVLKRL
jgi:hypothetical protein